MVIFRSYLSLPDGRQVLPSQLSWNDDHPATHGLIQSTDLDGANGKDGLDERINPVGFG